MSKHKIKWLNIPGYAGQTWNPVIGCSHQSPGCQNCYAERMANRLAQIKSTGYYKNVISPTGQWNGKTHTVKHNIDKPLSWKKPRAVFVCDMGDLFHDTVHFDTISEIYNVMHRCPQHLFLVLTKRPHRMWKFYNQNGTYGQQELALDNLWIGITAENNKQYNHRMQAFLPVPAAKKFVSIEPMLGPINLASLDGSGGFPINPLNPEYGHHTIDWVICGGESGHKHRPLYPGWVRNLKGQCQQWGTPFFFKQWGGHSPAQTGNTLDGKIYEEFPIISKSKKK